MFIYLYIIVHLPPETSGALQWTDLRGNNEIKWEFQKQKSEKIKNIGKIKENEKNLIDNNNNIDIDIDIDTNNNNNNSNIDLDFDMNRNNNNNSNTI